MLELTNISVNLNNFKLSEINLTVEHGDYFVIAGPSGSGKSILLETIAGLRENQTRGNISLSGEDLRQSSIRRRRVGMVFQDNTLFPHLTVERNITFALDLHTKKPQRREIFTTLCRELMLNELLHRSPMTLSGGETQRVLLARTLASKPEILLLDEPLSNVDAHQKDQLKNLLRKLNRSGQTIIHVTHDFEEAYSLANKMGIMHKGQLIDSGTPEHIVSAPANHFSAWFCGYKNYYRVLQQKENQVYLSDEVVLKLAEKSLHDTPAVLVKESMIKVADNKDGFCGKENMLKGKLRDYSRSPQGIELTVDAGLEFHIIVSSEIIKKNNWQPGQALFLQIPEQAIQPIRR